MPARRRVRKPALLVASNDDIHTSHGGIASNHDLAIWLKQDRVDPVVVLEAVADKIGGEHGLDRLSSEEVDGVIGQANQAHQQIERQRKSKPAAQGAQPAAPKAAATGRAAEATRSSAPATAGETAVLGSSNHVLEQNDSAMAARIGTTLTLPAPALQTSDLGLWYVLGDGGASGWPGFFAGKSGRLGSGYSKTTYRMGVVDLSRDYPLELNRVLYDHINNGIN